jgi:integrase
MKERKGYVYYDQERSAWIARISFTVDGKRKQIRKQFSTEEQANRGLEKLNGQLESEESRLLALSEKMSFSQLADEYKAAKVKPASYRNDKKISGMRGYKKVELRMKSLIAYFGSMRIRTITPSHVEGYRDKRLSTKTKDNRDRSIADVQRDLEILRAMFRFAKAQGWISLSPFERSTEPLIRKSHESRRTRILTSEEEERLISACNSSLKPLVIAAIDTGMRKGELLSLIWSDVDLPNLLINVRAITTKTLENRQLPISSRLASELSLLPKDTPTVFNLKKVQRAWEGACKKAGLEDLRLHDLRHCFCSKLISSGLPLAEVAKLSGHADVNILYRIYFNTNSATIETARKILDFKPGNPTT